MSTRDRAPAGVPEGASPSGDAPLGPGPAGAGEPIDHAPGRVSTGRRIPLTGWASERRRARIRRRRRLLLAALSIVVLVLVAAVAWYEIEAHPFGRPGARVVVKVKSGEGSGAVAQTLEHKGVVGSSLALRLSLLVHGTLSVEAGAYLFHVNQSFSKVRSILDGGPDVFYVDILPGYTLSEVAGTLEGMPARLTNHFVADAKDGAVRSSLEPAGTDNLEGLLGTGTYQVLPGETAQQLLTQMVVRFEGQAAAAGLTDSSAAALGMTPYQVVTVASIAQKEGYFDKYMGKVARVVYNRLAAGTPLDMTSTVLYALGQDGGPVTTADRTLDTPYNTYLHTGLTPTPICSPSVAALAAAASPPPGAWLYFTVVDKSGKTLFADTYVQQLAHERLARSNGVG